MHKASHTFEFGISEKVPSHFTYSHIHIPNSCPPKKLIGRPPRKFWILQCCELADPLNLTQFLFLVHTPFCKNYQFQLYFHIIVEKKRRTRKKKEKGEHLLAISSNRSSWVWELDTDVAVADGGETNLDRKWIAF